MDVRPDECRRLAEIQIRSKIRYMSEPAIDIDALERRMAGVASAREKTYNNWDVVKAHILKGQMHGPGGWPTCNHG